MLRGGAPTASATGSAVEVYTTPGCSYCRKAKSLLKRLKVEYDEIDVSDNEDVRDDMIRRAGAATLPQLESGRGLWILRTEWEARGALVAREACAFSW